MKIVIFGLTVSSSWGNGHATLWRGLFRALAQRGCHVVFFERDVPYYAATRDLYEIERGKLILYRDWAESAELAAHEVGDADAAIVTSYCPDGIEAADTVLAAPWALRVFYTLNTPVTLARLQFDGAVSYIGPRGLGEFDLVLSFTGGNALLELERRLGARRIIPLYGHVDLRVHHRVASRDQYQCDLSYLGTYSQDRQVALDALFIEPSRRCPSRRFVIGGAQYPQDFPWTPNTYFVRHLPPEEHSAFYSSSRLTVNVTREPMAAMGWCPSGRLFEAAACGTVVLSDWWPGLDEFFKPGEEILIASNSADALGALELSDSEIARIGSRARDRVLEQHTSERRAEDLLAALAVARRSDRSIDRPLVEI
jgi:spore maturation protein CgeB